MLANRAKRELTDGSSGSWASAQHRVRQWAGRQKWDRVQMGRRVQGAPMTTRRGYAPASAWAGFDHARWKSTQNPSPAEIWKGWGMVGVRVKDSKRPRPGRRFEPGAELELEADALRAIRGIPGAHRNLTVYREVAGPFGIPDFLAVVGPKTALRRRIALGVPPLLNEIDAGVVGVASAKVGHSAEYLAARLGWSEGTIQRRLSILLRAGALEEISGNRFVRPERLAPIGKLYAVETKVANFKRALRQARSYALWCENYVIVMPALSEASLFSASEAVAANHGGLVVDGKWAQRLRARRITNARRLWGSEHVVAAVIGG